MSFNISKFKSNLLYGGARSNLFEMQMGLPAGIDFSSVGIDTQNFFTKLRFLCNASSIPSTSVEVVQVPFYGREIYTVGTKTFDPFSITIINDEDFYLRRAFEHWVGSLNGHSSNQKVNGASSSPNSYQTEGTLKQFSQSKLGTKYIDKLSIKSPVRYDHSKYDDEVYDPLRPDKFVDRRFSKRNSPSGSPSSEGAIPIAAYKFVNMFPISVSSMDLNWNSNTIEEFSVAFRYDYWEYGSLE